MHSIYKKFFLLSLSIALLSASPLRAEVVADPISDVSVSLAAPATAPTDTTISYVFKVKNGGPQASETTSLTVQLPEKGELVTQQTPQGSCSVADAVLTCALGKIESAATVQVVVQWKTPSDAATLEISADATTSSSIDENSVNDHSSAFTEVNKVVTDPMADLKIFVRPIASVEANNVINYSFEIENQGPDASASTHMSMIIPREGQYVSIVPEQGTCALVQADVLDCDLQNLASGRIVKIAMRWKAPAQASTLRFVANVDGAAIDTHLEDNDLDFQTTIDPAPQGPTPGSSAPAPKAEGNWACSMAAASASASGFLWTALLLVIPSLRLFRRR